MGFDGMTEPVALGLGRPIRGTTRFKLKKDRWGQLGAKVWGISVWNGAANVESLRSFRGEERLRQGIQDSLRALRAGVAIGGRWEPLNIASLRERERKREASLYKQPARSSKRALEFTRRAAIKYKFFSLAKEKPNNGPWDRWVNRRAQPTLIFL